MKVLIAIDGSPISREMIATVLRYPWPMETQFRVLTVAEQKGAPSMLDVISTGGSVETVQEATQRAAGFVAASGAAELRKAGLSAEPQEAEGDARRAIPEQAEQWGADLIVVGSYGRSGIRRLLLGSVAEAVVKAAPCSVLLIRPQTADRH